ncbi:RNA polymerase sigma factor [Polyangium jinanense]|uniref:RNA polymerase sigma factor n=1 Tax=Polyangium jinanense TaxID=2829994 RepID=A0A9X4AVS0_9BACT|nr:sigma-70 family RNA polymerase sigma factor [Polyangium jinanense]MDC3960159.1 sigma-70 family RNA polymerase sigma factor [Polyangium jinanense]MDC3986599.1 sigma-70 family RNA polymerase sigma factor [Polyangium jinanense]
MTNLEVCPESAKKPVTFPSPEASFAQFYRECWGFVRSVLLKRGVPEREADDLTQEVFVVAWRRRDSMVWDRQARAWLYTVAGYIAANHCKLARHRTEAFVAELPEPAVHPQVTQAMDATRLLWRALPKLGAKLAPVLVAYEIEGRSMPEIARTLGIRLKTAYARLQLARNRLAHCAPV